jgi:hypothetical protein
MFKSASHYFPVGKCRSCSHRHVVDKAMWHAHSWASRIHTAATLASKDPIMATFYLAKCGSRFRVHAYSLKISLTSKLTAARLRNRLGALITGHHCSMQTSAAPARETLVKFICIINLNTDHLILSFPMRTRFGMILTRWAWAKLVVFRMGVAWYAHARLLPLCHNNWILVGVSDC